MQDIGSFHAKAQSDVEERPRSVASWLQVKVKCLQTVIKILQYTPASGLAVLLASSPISSFTASLLTNPDATILAGGLRVAELLQLKLPEIFTTSLLKEGVVHAIESLAMEAPAAPSASLEKQRPKRASSRLKVRPLSVLLTKESGGSS